MDYDKNREREYKQRMMWTATTIVAALAAFAVMVFWNASASMRSSFSAWLSLDVDLAGCAVSFAQLLMAGTALSIGLGIISAGLVASNAMDIFSYKRNLRVYRKQLFVGIFLAVLLLFPLMAGDGVWHTGGRRGISRVDLVTACAASFHTTFYRLHMHLLIALLLGWANILAMLNLRWMIAENRDPNQLSDDPRIRAIQLAAMQRTKSARGSARVVMKLALTGFAALFFVLGASSMRPAVARFIHTFTWERQTANVVETGMQCALEVKVRRRWEERSRVDCSSDAAAIPPTPAPGAASLRITKIPTAKLTYHPPSGGEYTFDVAGDFYVKMPTSVGTEIEVLRNPKSPGSIDKIFDGGDIERMIYKLLAIIAGAVAIYYLWLRKPQNPRPV
ncbi:hypothetical protein FJV76_20860 [Mesorhizobium sp. WSM4303]|uniref:hypothetical protein n=1 Tax=unclassified Mesorhizobium TaxID=325217 RepID=UPI00115F1086|nr:MULTISPECIES: hypothetical protein [unclassified Mesorhizobium]TRC94871.1 hypothetical protein FJV77_18025 [Mesorhizobium sp. WSM4306]TRD01847.1 hypothetical protein FJV76_20860 [Mesorhizobium sp. WSM4303]